MVSCTVKGSAKILKHPGSARLGFGRQRIGPAGVTIMKWCGWFVAFVQVSADAPDIVAGVQRLADCLDKVSTFGDKAPSLSSGSPMSTATYTSGR